MHDEVRNERIAARVMGDAARATKMGDSKSTTKVSPLGNGGRRVGDKKGGTRSLQEKLLIGRWGTPLGQQKWGTQTHRCLGDGRCRSGNNNGGLKVHNISMDATWVTNMGDSKSARKIADRAMGDAARAIKMGDSKSSRAMGGAAWVTENGGL
jgi:hypothetical protein